jgi:hypothetical protein
MPGATIVPTDQIMATVTDIMALLLVSLLTTSPATMTTTVIRMLIIAGALVATVHTRPNPIPGWHIAAA